jgi:hypothetical protein
MRTPLIITVVSFFLGSIFLSACGLEATSLDPAGISKTNQVGPVQFGGSPLPEAGDSLSKPTQAVPKDTGAGHFQMSDPCSTDSQCAGGKCLDVAGVGQNYCTQLCENSSCPAGNTCYSFSTGRFCLKECTASSQCHPWLICDQDYTCWPGNEPVDPELQSKAATSDPCTNDDQCDGGKCMDIYGTEQHYCTQSCHNKSCPAGDTCYTFSSGRLFCLKECTAGSQCHPWLICDQDYTCWPGDNPIDELEPEAPVVPTAPVEPVVEPEDPPKAQTSDSCTSDDQCQGGKCLEVVGITQNYCTQTCDYTACPDDETCFVFSTGRYCLKECTANAQCHPWLICDQDNTCWPGDDPVGAPPQPTNPNPGPSPTVNCNELPQKSCTGGGCADLLPFDPDEGPGYIDYPENGETWNNQYRSYARRDLIMLVKWAAAWVECTAKDWPGGNGHPLGLGDMSEGNGNIPGTSDGDPGHPNGTHINGRDMDIAYYQQTGPDNHLRPVCPHGGNYHCTGAPDNLDVNRTALFIGALLSSTRTRVIGVDGKIGPLIEDAMDTLKAQGYMPPKDSGADASLSYETVNNGNGWYYFHHHHLHISLWGGSYKPGVEVGPQCLTPDCSMGPGSLDYPQGCRLDQKLDPPISKPVIHKRP